MPIFEDDRNREAFLELESRVVRRFKERECPYLKVSR
jgi:hypothetical protein